MERRHLGGVSNHKLSTKPMNNCNKQKDAGMMPAFYKAASWIVVKPFPVFSAEPARVDILFEQRCGTVFWIADALM